jgi:hypothetical protein
MSRIAPTIIIASALLSAGVAHAKQTPEQKCQKGRCEAAAKYAACQQKAMGKFYGGGEYEKFRNAIGKCTTKYTATWPKLQKKAAGTGATCDTARFADNGDGTVTDWLTGLQWEQKTDDATIHDKDNVYSWTATPPFTAANGTAFTSFLAPLNGGGCFAGQCDWRLPTVAELQTILLAPYPCTTSPCVDEGLFGPTVAIGYWSATANADLPGFAWVVNFNDGDVVNINKDGADYVRAVRSGP